MGKQQHNRETIKGTGERMKKGGNLEAISIYVRRFPSNTKKRQTIIPKNPRQQTFLPTGILSE
jgi:hypothetical protein